MLFKTTNTIKSKKSADFLRSNLLGQHLTINGLDFMISQTEDIIRIVPNLDNETHIYTLPVSRLVFNQSNDGTQIKLKSHPRRIDIGGPYLLLFFIAFTILAGIMLLVKGEGNYDATAYILIGIATLAVLILYIFLQLGYFSYIRKIKYWVKKHS